MSPLAMSEGSIFSMFSLTLVIIYLSHSSRYRMVSHYSFDLHFPEGNNVSMCLLSVSVSYSLNSAA